MTLIIGAEGSMGRRYQSILKFLNVPFECHDLKTLRPVGPLEKYDRFIIATPTNTHLAWVRALDHYGCPILCEKPLSKDLSEAQEIAACKSPLTMQMQYLRLTRADDVGHSFYDYFHHGQDGLVWDCFQIVALAQGDCALLEESPVWRCMINGRTLLRGQMDLAYVEFVRAWVQGENLTPRDKLIGWHEKVKRFEEKWTLRTSR